MADAFSSFAPARPYAGDLLRPTALAAAIGRRIVAWDARYRERCHMVDLSDETLDDIGTSRRDMEAEARRHLRHG